MWTFEVNAVNTCVITQIESSCGLNLKCPKAFILWHLPAYITVNKAKDTLQACANYFGYLRLKLKGKYHFDVNYAVWYLQWCWFSQYSLRVVAIIGCDCWGCQVFWSKRFRSFLAVILIGFVMDRARLLLTSGISKLFLQLDSDWVTYLEFQAGTTKNRKAGQFWMKAMICSIWQS